MTLYYFTQILFHQLNFFVINNILFLYYRLMIYFDLLYIQVNRFYD